MTAASRVLEILRREGSELVADPDTADEVTAQIAAIASAAVAALRRQRDTAAATPAPRSLSIGERRAAAQMHPTVSLHAADLAFQEIYPLLLAALPELTEDAAVRAALELQRIINATITTAAIGYVDYLLERLSTVHLEERRALAGQLHDRVAQGIAAATQRMRAPQIPVEQVVAILSEALEETRSIALELRQLVGERRLDEALDTYLTDLGCVHPVVTMYQRGVPRRAPTLQQEESFLIVRESITNAIKHANASNITVTLDWQKRAIAVTIADDGRGFDPADTPKTRMGLLVSRERADAINASLEIEPSLGRGTIVEFTLHG